MKKRNHRFFIKQGPMVHINVVPYIDVMLVLRVIFMITTPILTQGVKVDLPKAQSEKIPSTESKPIV
ncbi:biopolymer transporter ExbD, partial [Francisella tularensis]|uniref:biopolymer transporter ExbD n=1 Tax=Francisella tularensis TaxID=263 RepID=UPI0023819BDE